MTRLGPKARLAAASAMALALTACDDRGGRVDAPEPASLADLSAMGELPYAEPARVDYRPPAQGYAWAERAYGLQRAVYDTPPDYGFYYDDVEPLVWETDDDWVMYAEPWDEGYRYYYYEPGAYYPYFVRDDRYGYGYGDGGVLIAVFDLGGRYLPVETVYSVAPVAGRYYARGHDLRTAAVKARRIQVTDQIWSQRAPQVIRTADPWLRAARDDRGWRAWRERDQDRELRRFEPEAERRAARTRAWRERDDRRERAAIQGEDPRRSQQVEIQRQAERRQGFEAERRQAFDQRREQAERQQRRQAQMEQVEQQRAQQVQRRAQVDQRQREGAQRAQEQRRQQVEQQERRAQQHERRQVEQAQQHRREQVEQQEQRRQQAEQQARRQAENQQRAQQAQQQRQQADQRQAQHQQRQQAQQQRQQAEQRQAQQQQRQQAQQHQQQARSAQQQGQPAAGRERGGGDHRQGRGPHDKKD